MTREAKIGMLTGLGVIVLIGVLLSEYLGDRNTGPAVAAGATGRGAILPVGAGYREQIMSPVAVPAMTPAGGGDRTVLPGGVELASAITTSGAGGTTEVTGNIGGTPMAQAVGARVGEPVTPMPAGVAAADRRGQDGPPLIRLRDTVPVLAPGGLGVATVAAAPTGKTYTIVAGDTLAKISRKFYNSAKNADIHRIVAANKGVLKDATTMLAVGMKLTIPDVPAPVQASAPSSGSGTATMVVTGGDGTVVPLPSGVVPNGVNGVIQPPKMGGTGTGAAKDGPAEKKPGTYVVKAGDTLDKIARAQAPTKLTEYVAKVMKLNGIKDVKGLQVGQTLKLPV